MTDDTRTLLLEVAPLLAVAALYALVVAVLGISLLRAPRRPWLGVAVWLLVVVVAGGAATLGGLRLADRDLVRESDDWAIALASAALALAALIVLVQWRQRTLLMHARERAREAEELASERGREADAISRLSDALSQTQTAREAAGFLFDEVEALLEPDAMLLALVDPATRNVFGFASRGVDDDWWRSVVLDLDADAGAMVTVVRDGLPTAIYDVPSATTVNRSLADAVGARSAAFIPLYTEGDVAGVLVVATREHHRDFEAGELELVQDLAGETALALGRTRSSEALRAALERERLVAEIGRRVRSELDLDTVLEVAVEETARAVGVAHCFVRMGEPGGPMPIVAEWHAPDVEPVGGQESPQLPVSNLAARERRTVVVEDIDRAAELDDPALGGRGTLHTLGVRAVLATPILVFEEMIGVFGLHRTRVSRWAPGEVALAEAIGRELGLAIHTARLLRENERRLRRQETLIQAAQVLTSDLRFESVIRHLVEEVVSLTGADAADCWVLEPDRKLLRCRAVVGVPEWNVGRQIPVEGTIGRSIESGRTVLTHDFAAAEQPPPSPPYAVFNDVMSIPITWLGEVRGALGVCAREAGHFDQADVEVLETFARFASLALHNAESFEARERQAQVQRGFYRVAEVLGSPLSLAETLDALAQAASEALGGAAAAVLELRGDELALAGAHALPDPVRDRLDTGLHQSLSPFARTATEGRILTASEVAGDDRFHPSLRDLLLGEGFGSLLCAPVAGVREQTYAVAVLFRGRRAFTDEDVLLTRHLSDAARGALERSELFEVERRARTVSQRLARVGAILSTSLDPAVVHQEVAREAPALLGGDAAVIRLLAGEELVVRTAYGPGTAGIVGTSAHAAAGVSGMAAQSRSPLPIRDAREQAALARGDLLLERDMAACVAVPMVAHGGALYGVLAVYSRAPRAWREDEVQALAALAAAAAASVANAELYQRVAEEKERGGAILAHIADGIVAVDRDDRIVLWNAMAEQITGVPASEALGRRVPDVLQRELAGDESRPPRERHVPIRRGGEEVWLALTEAVMLDAAGAVGGRIFAFRDVSSERVVEQMKSAFVSTVSHELRTPLTSIYGFAETLMRSDVDFTEAERATFLRYIVTESERLIRIVDDLLNVARLDAGTLVVSLEPTDLAEVAEEAVARTASYAGDAYSFAVDVAPGSFVVRADRDKLSQVLTNLLDNAVRYSPRGGRITVGARRRTDTAEIVVADEGMGIPRGDRERIFTKFFRTERGAATGPAGSGLGLFLVRGLVAAMGGRIWVESEEDRGSRFIFELPLEDAGVRDETPLGAAAPS